MDEEREPTPAEIAKFRKAAKALAELGKAGLYIYLAEDNLHLMTGPSHDPGGKNSMRQDRIRATARIPLAGGGDW